MKLTILILTSLVFCISCNNSNANKSFFDNASTKEKTDASKSQRELLIEELKKLKVVIASNNKETIAQLFPFPLADTTLGIYIDDSTYFKEFRKNGGKTTKAMFLKYFQQIYQDMQLDQISELFKYLNLDSLSQKDTLQYEVRSEKEPCYKFYHVYIAKDTVTLEFGTNTNKDYVDSSIKTEDDEGSGDECEFASIWTFKFDGLKLHFVMLVAAG